MRVGINAVSNGYTLTVLWAFYEWRGIEDEKENAP